MFGVSIPEILLVCAVILIVLGPDRLPDATRKAARVLGQFRRQADAIRRELYNSMYIPADELKGDFTTIQDNLRAVKEEITNILPNIPEELMNCEERAKAEEQKRLKEIEKEGLAAVEKTGE